jgi:hypothetical protein
MSRMVDLYLHSPTTPSWRGAQLKHRDNFSSLSVLLSLFFYLISPFFFPQNGEYHGNRSIERQSSLAELRTTAFQNVSNPLARVLINLYKSDKSGTDIGTVQNVEFQMCVRIQVLQQLQYKMTYCYSFWWGGVKGIFICICNWFRAMIPQSVW